MTIIYKMTDTAITYNTKHKTFYVVNHELVSLQPLQIVS